MNDNFDAFFDYNKEKHEEETKKRRENESRGNAPKDKLIIKKDYDYSLVLLPYIHGPQGFPPIVEISMHFRISGKSFPCPYDNNLEEFCVVEEFIKKLWDKWNEYEQAYGKQSDQCRQVVSTIRNLQAAKRWYSPVLVVDVRDSDGDKVQDELKKWKSRVVWWDYPETIYKQIDKECKQKGTLWHPEDPALFIVSKEDATNAKTKKSYIKPTLMIDFPREKGKYRIVKNKKQITQLLKMVPNLYDTDLITVLTNAEIQKLLDAAYSKDGDDKDTRFDPSEFEGKIDPFEPDTRRAPSETAPVMPDIEESDFDDGEGNDDTDTAALASEVTDLFGQLDTPEE